MGKSLFSYSKNGYTILQKWYKTAEEEKWAQPSICSSQDDDYDGNDNKSLFIKCIMPLAKVDSKCLPTQYTHSRH